MVIKRCCVTALFRADFKSAERSNVGKSAITTEVEREEWTEDKRGAAGGETTERVQVGSKIGDTQKGGD